MDPRTRRPSLPSVYAEAPPRRPSFPAVYGDAPPPRRPSFPAVYMDAPCPRRPSLPSVYTGAPASPRRAAFALSPPATPTTPAAAASTSDLTRTPPTPSNARWASTADLGAYDARFFDAAADDEAPAFTNPWAADADATSDTDVAPKSKPYRADPIRYRLAAALESFRFGVFRAKRRWRERRASA